MPKSLPKYFGPGNWNALHLMAANAHTDSEKNAVLYLINLYATKFYCSECQEHFNKFIRKHPPMDYYNRENGLFYWTWKAHNTADKYAGNKQKSYDKVKEFYGV